jgi:mycofactocin precursor
MAEINPLTNQNATPDVNTPTEPDVMDDSTEADLLEEELEELVIEDFTIDGICGVY